MGMIISIGLGGAVGALGRHFLSSQIALLFGSGFPFGILAVNVLGCFAMGAIAEASVLGWNLTAETRSFLVTGILGGFTTFSAFALDTAVMLERHDLMGAMLYVLGSVAGSVAALFLGLYVVRTVFS